MQEDSNAVSAGPEFPQSPDSRNACCSRTGFLQPCQDALWSKYYCNPGCWFGLCLSTETTSKKVNGCSARCYEQHRQDRGRKKTQTAAYPWKLCKKRGTRWAFPTAKVPATIAKPRQSRRDSSMRSPRVTIHFKVSRKVEQQGSYCIGTTGWQRELSGESQNAAAITPSTVWIYRLECHEDPWLAVSWLTGCMGPNSHEAHAGFWTSAQVQAFIFSCVSLSSPFLPKPEFYHLAKKRFTPNSRQSGTQHTQTTSPCEETFCDRLRSA